MTVDLKTIGQLASVFAAGASGMYYAQKLRRNGAGKTPPPAGPRNGERTDILIALGRIENRQITQDGKMERLDGKIQGMQGQIEDMRGEITVKQAELTDLTGRVIRLERHAAAGSST